jgi:Fanconi anemia group M protein
VGRVIVLMSRGTRDEVAYRSSQSKEKKMYKTMQNMKDGQAMTTLTEGAWQSPPAEAEDAAVMTGGSDTVSLQPAPQQQSPTAGQTKLEGVRPGDNAGAHADGVVVLTDTREMRSQVVKKLEELGAKLDFKTLEVGDYVLSDRVCIERKTTDDFLSTIFDANRNMFEQIINMKHEFLRPMLIIEGDGLYTKRRINPAAIQGIIASITIDYGVPVLFTADEGETASYVYTIARREQMDRKRSVHPHAQKSSQTLPERQEYLVSAISEVGPVIAKNLLRHFGSVKNIAAASLEELTAVERVGPKTAARIREIMDAEYKPRE